MNEIAELRINTCRKAFYTCFIENEKNQAQ